jgi:hypothetical protein
MQLKSGVKDKNKNIGETYEITKDVYLNIAATKVRNTNNNFYGHFLYKVLL